VKISQIRVERREIELDPPFEAAWDPNPRRSFEATLVLVETDEGLTGIGSGDAMDGFERHEHHFVGRSALDLAHHQAILEMLSRYAAGGRYWPLEAALWDLAGKAEGKPLVELLGGVTAQLPAYASTGVQLPPRQRAESALALRDEGFVALKVRIDRRRVEEGLAAVSAVREAVGNSMEIMVDLNQGWRMPGDDSSALDRETVRRIAERLQDLDILWLEEPLPKDDVAGYAELRKGFSVRVAGGEMAETIAELEAFEGADALDVYQPDAVLSVGLSRAVELGRRVIARGRWFTPHTWTNGIGLLTNLHVVAAAGGGPFVEFPYDPPWWTPERRDFMLAEPIHAQDGYVTVPDKPGLGFELADAAL
jgi:L-alanine-DL-glutamate epimerase-like enolase superfamily enzyme